MQAIKSRITRALNHCAEVQLCDNSGGKVLKITSVVGLRTSKGRQQYARVGDLVMGSIKKGKPDMRKTVVFAVIVRQRKEYKRPDGTRIKFEDNAAVVCKDEKGNPKGTLIKGPIAKEAASRWPFVAKMSSMIV
jgi:large subunit ribosomal protein L14